MVSSRSHERVCLLQKHHKLLLNESHRGVEREAKEG